MVRFLTDEDFSGPILAGVRLRLPKLDIVRVQDIGLRTKRDEFILHVAAEEDRVVLSHDESTMGVAAARRIDKGLPMPGLFLIPQSVPIGTAIEEIVLVAMASIDREWEHRIHFLPL